MELFAVSPPGLEEMVATELRQLGIDGRVVHGGVEWTGDAPSMRRVNLHARIVARVLVRVAAFRARTFFELERHAGRLPWGSFVRTGANVQWRVTSRKSRLYHEGAIAERLQRALEAATGAKLAPGADQETEGEAGQLFIVRVERDAFTISADTSGALLHRRGYRQEIARAPLRENLAAALIAAAEWKGSEPLFDPFCGSGTIPIEAALIARRIPPGLANPDHVARAYAFEGWPDHDETAWRREVAAARAQILERAGVAIHGSDRSAAAIRAARSNAARAGVIDDIVYDVTAMKRARVPDGTGALVTNPPYGVRVTDDQAMRALYAELGEFVRDRLRGWRVVMLSPDEALERETRLGFIVISRTKNGGIPVRIVRAGRREDSGNGVESSRYD